MAFVGRTTIASGRSNRAVRDAEFRFYEELNDFLPPEKRKRSFAYMFEGTPSIKDAIEAVGVPHTEIDIILVDGRSVGFDHRLRGGERVAVYPMFEAIDVSPLVRLRPQPLRITRFVVDVHLGAPRVTCGSLVSTRSGATTSTIARSSTSPRASGGSS